MKVNDISSFLKKIKKKHIVIACICATVVFAFISGNINRMVFNEDMSRAREYIKAGKLDDAKKILDGQLKTDASRDELYIVYADYYLVQNDYINAIEILQKGIARCYSDREMEEKLNSIQADHPMDNVAIETQKQENKQQEAKKQEKDYRTACKMIDYRDLARNPDKYKGELFKFTGEIIQVVEPVWGNTVSLRINVTKGDYGIYKDTIYATVELPAGSDRLLKDDIVTIYGECDGLYTYNSVLNSSVSIPKISIKYFELEPQTEELR